MRLFVSSVAAFALLNVSMAQAACTSKERVLMAPAPNAAQFGVLMYPPMAPKLPLCANGDFGRSPIYRQHSDAHCACVEVGTRDVKHKRESWNIFMNII